MKILLHVKFICKSSTLIILFVLFNVTGYTQLKADFSASDSSGCSPLVVSFKDISTGNPNSWSWDLGNGTVSDQKYPSTIYITPGTYSVKLVIKDATGNIDSITKTSFITVYAKPIVDFSASPSNGCVPLAVKFNDKTNPVSGTEQSWHWDFGDGTSSTEQNPVHTYSLTDTFNVTLTVTNSFGCTQSNFKNSFIAVADTVTSDFSYTYSSICNTPSTFNFTNLSKSGTTLTYSWDFGDGAKSTTINPSHIYTSPGNYNITLITTNKNGCSDTAIKTVAVGTKFPNFILPPTGCIGQVIVMRDSSTPVPVSGSWNFGDGATATGLTTTHTYNNAGSYTITYKTNFEDCIDSIKKIITIVSKPVVSFSSPSVRTSCYPPLTVQFANTSTGATTYFWRFGDGTTSTDINPVHTYTTTGVFDVTLIASNGAGGCSDSITQKAFVKISPPVITSFVNLPFRECAPATVPFNANIDSTEPIKSFFWNFGDGTTSTSRSPVHTYNNTGTYDVSLIVVSNSGCSDTLILNSAVVTSSKPTAKFSGAPLNTCAFQEVEFVDQSTGGVNYWEWHFGDGTTSNNKNPSHKYGDTGYFSVTLIVKDNGCKDSITIPNYVHINPPVAAFAAPFSCNNKMSRNFKDRSVGPVTWNWNFADGTTSTEQNPTHTYTKNGIYNATLIVTNGTCADTTTRVIAALDENPQFTVAPLHTNFCKEDTMKFTTTNYDTSYVTNFYWDFGDGNNLSGASDNIALYNYDNAGVYNPILITTDINGCTDTAKNATAINIYGPTALFSNSAGACKDSAITFKDSSLSDGIHSLTKWIWDYGDGTIDTLTAGSSSHVYDTTGSYNVKLTVFDTNGCEDTLSKPGVLITKPIADFTVFDSLRCTTALDSFINSSVGLSLTYLWNFGDGISSAEASPNHAYANEGIYTVGVKVRDRFGCTDSIIKPNIVTVSDPHASFTAIYDTSITCPPLPVQTRNASSNYTSSFWNFGDGNTSTIDTPFHSYTIPGQYFLTLVVHGYGNCFDTAEQLITLKGPSGTFNFTPQSGCFPQTVSFNAVAKNAILYTWDFNDGSTQSTVTNQVSYQYKTPGAYIPKLILQDAAGCRVPFVSKDTIKITGVIPKFVANTQTGCDSSMAAFIDSSAVLSFDGIANWSWNFGDGRQTTGSNPVHYYKTPGTYTTTLDVTTDSGCTGHYELPVSIQINKAPKIQSTFPDSVCVNTTINFVAKDTANVTGSLQWSWNFNNGDTSNLQNTSYTYTSPGKYNVSVTSTASTGCADTANKIINILALPPVDAGADSVLCLKQSITLQPAGASSYVWQRSSSLSCTNCTSPVASPDSSTTYFVTGTDAFGCKASDSININVIQPTQLSVLTPGDTVCLGGSVQLNVTGAQQYTWQPSTGLSNANISNPVASPPTVGVTTYTVIGADNKKCFADTAQIAILVAPIPTFNISDSFVTLNVGSTYQIKTTSSPDVINWVWLPSFGLSCSNCATPLAQPRGNITYKATAVTGFGCAASDNITFSVLCNNANVFIPNTFSPNNDSRNDYFFAQGKGLFTIKSLRIFNRWGVMVFERSNFPANNQSYGWDGKYNGQDQPTDVYVYVMDIMCDNGTVLTYKGNVTLIR